MEPVEVPNETPSTALGGDITAPEETTVDLEPDFLKQAENRVQDRLEEVKQEEVPMPLEQWNKMIEEAEKAVEDEKKATVELDFPETEESKKKTYMTKDETGKIQIKDRS
jgi:hypothetical protein